MECGTRVGQAPIAALPVGVSVPEPMRRMRETASPVQLQAATPGQGSRPYQAPPLVQSQGSSGSSGVLLIGVLLLVGAIILLVGVLLFAQNSEKTSEQPSQFEVISSDNEPEEEKGASTPIELTQSYTTDSLTPRSKAYPAFKFKYPEHWEVDELTLSPFGEILSVEAASNVSVTYQLLASSEDEPYTVRVGNVEKLADSSLVSSGSGGGASSSSSHAEKFVVAQFSIRSSDSPYLSSGDTVMALIPESGLSDSGKIDFSSGVPGFKYDAYNVCFFMVFDDKAILERRKQEASAILSSFEYAREVPASDVDESYIDKHREDYSSYDFILPYSDMVLLGEGDLYGYSAYDLYLARNEIYARHGRMFVNDDLNSYFNSKAWYRPSIAPEDFNDSMLNQTERDNLQTILTVERSIGSPYV